jgi:hypothetical protein
MLKRHTYDTTFLKKNWFLQNFMWSLFFIVKLRTFHFFIEIENFRGEGNILMRHTHETTFSEKILEFYKF